MSKSFFYLCALIDVFVSSQKTLYKDANNVYTVKVDESLTFDEAQAHCKGLKSGELALIKNRDLSEKITEEIHALFKSTASE